MKSISKSIFKSNISITILNVNIWNAPVKSKNIRLAMKTKKYVFCATDRF